MELNRHQIEEAVLEAQHLITTLRGVQGLVTIVEVVLNQTKLCDGLQEKVGKLEDKIASLKRTHDIQLETQRLAYEQTVNEHTLHLTQLSGQIKKHKDQISELQNEYRTKRVELEHTHQAAVDSHATYMKDMGNKQRDAELNLQILTEQLEQIRARFK